MHTLNIIHFMKLKGLFWVVSLAASSVCLLFSCNNGSADQTDSEDVEMNESVATNEEETIPEVQVFYQVPSPSELINLIKEAGIDYSAEVLSNPNNIDDYIDQKSKALNMGLLSTDLAYAASFSEFQESRKYFNMISKLAEDLGVASAFSDDLLKRIRDNMENADSLELISMDSYYSIVSELEANDRGKVLAMIAAGGWLESVYIVTHSIEEYEDNEVMQRIADQKLTYENLMHYMQNYESVQMVSSTISDFQGITDIFNSLQVTTANKEFKSDGSKKVLGGTGKIHLEKDEFESLKAEVMRVRNGILQTANIN